MYMYGSVGKKRKQHVNLPTRTVSFLTTPTYLHPYLEKPPYVSPMSHQGNNVVFVNRGCARLDLLLDVKTLSLFDPSIYSYQT